MTDLINFFAYDELMDPKNMDALGLPHKALFSVTLSAFKLTYNKIPAEPHAPAGLGLASIEPAPNNLGMMEGVMYEMDAALLKKLDEHYQVPNEYQRKNMRFTKHDFALVNAWVYMAHPDRRDDSLKPSKAMLKKLRGARKNLQMLYFSRLMNTPTVD
jgi:hypothetical protein